MKTKITIALLTGMILTGCGGQPYSRTVSRQPAYTASNTDLEPNHSDTVSSGSSSSSSKTNLSAPYSLRVAAVGYTSTTVSVKALKTLKIKFTPGIQNEPISGTNNYPQYAGLGVFITVGSTTKTTPLLYNGLFGGNPQSSEIIDFSSALPDHSTSSKITITISQPNYDYWCINYRAGCPWSHVSDDHAWNGTLQVQTDDTDSL